MASMRFVAIAIMININNVTSQETSDLHCNRQELMCVDKYLRALESVQRINDENLQSNFQQLAQNLKSHWDCYDLKADGFSKSDVYEIFTGHFSFNKTIKVFCDMETDGGGWLVFQRRLDGSVAFTRNWIEFKNGFGSIDGEHWLGNKFLHGLTKSRNYELRVDLWDWVNPTGHRYAVYDRFHVDSEMNNYTLNLGSYSGNAGDSLAYQNGWGFTTYDRKNDGGTGRGCIPLHGYGGFWYNDCYLAALNNHYSTSSSGHGGKSEWDTLTWKAWHGDKYSLKATRMMMRPVD